jgi:hypothetical protein
MEARNAHVPIGFIEIRAGKVPMKANEALRPYVRVTGTPSPKTAEEGEIIVS